MRKLSIFLAVFLLLSMVTPCVAADDGEEVQSIEQMASVYSAETVADAEGWLFGLKEPRVTLYGMEEYTPEGIESLGEGKGVYCAETLEDIYDFAEAAEIEYIEPNYRVYLCDTPNDPKYTSGTQWDRKLMEVDDAWTRGLDGSGVRVGIIDTGLYAEHEDLVGANIIPGWNYANNSSNTGDTLGHGTFVAGVIAAQCNNGVGVAGIAPGAEIVSLRAFLDGEKSTTIGRITEAIYGGVDTYHCDILNMSIGAEGGADTLRAAVNYAHNRGVVMVAAAGNDGTATSTEDVLNYPAAYDNVIGVASINSDKGHSYFSQKNNSVWICAPGGYTYGLGISSPSTYYHNSGTSFSAPCVSALCALALQQDRFLTPDYIKAALGASAIDLGTTGWDSSYGYGMVTAPAFLRYLDSTNQGNPVTWVVEQSGIRTVYAQYSYWRDMASGTSVLGIYSGNRMIGLYAKPVTRGSLVEYYISDRDCDVVKLFTLGSGWTSPLFNAVEVACPSSS